MTFLFPSRITGPVGARFILPGAHKRLGSIALFYLALGASGVLLVLLYVGIAALFRTLQTQGQLTALTSYLLIAWGAVTAIFIILLIWRNVLSAREDDQIFPDAAEQHMAREREMLGKINALSVSLRTSGIAATVLFAIIAGILLYSGIQASR